MKIIIVLIVISISNSFFSQNKIDTLTLDNLMEISKKYNLNFVQNKDNNKYIFYYYIDSVDIMHKIAIENNIKKNDTIRKYESNIITSQRLLPFIIEDIDDNEERAFNDNITKSGELSRSINSSSNSNTSVLSQLELNMNGKLKDNININLKIKDNNIPNQQNYYTSSINQLDSIYISLYGNNWSLYMGDKILKNKNIDQNNNWHRDIKAMSYNYKNNIINTSSNLGISKGIYNQLYYKGSNFNQGPYKLIGKNNEYNIIILNKSIKVIVDNKLLNEGETEDYTVNYINGEIYFTNNYVINNSSRIEISFQYQNSEYSTIIFENEEEIILNKHKIRLNLFSEKDNKNINNTNFNNNELQLFSLIGNDISKAYSESSNITAYNQQDIQYKKIDSNGYNIYMYSTNIDDELYNLKFYQVESGKGNYIFEKYLPQGKLYKWIQPEISGNDTIMKGNYSIINIVSLPKSKNIVKIEHLYNASNLNSTSSISYSYNDPNLYSKINNDVNHSYLMNNNSKYKFGKNIFETHLEYKHKNFIAHQEYFSKEKETLLKLNNPNKSLINIGINYNYNDSNNNFTLKNNILNYYKEKIDLLNEVMYKLKYRNNNINVYNRMIYNSINGKFHESQLEIIKKFALTNIRFFTYYQKDEKKIYKSIDTNSLITSKYNLGIGQKINNKENTLRVEIEYRNLYQYKQNSYKELENNIDANLHYQVKGKNIYLINKHTYQINKVINSNEINRNLLNHISLNANMINSFVKLNFNYINNSGLEKTTEYTYIQVPIGSGEYQWIDFNNNQIQEIAEFVIAKFQNEANYNRFIYKGDNFYRINNSKVNTQISFDFSKISKTKPFKNFVNTVNYNSTTKSSNQEFFKNINLFRNNGQFFNYNLSNVFGYYINENASIIHTFDIINEENNIMNTKENNYLSTNSVEIDYNLNNKYVLTQKYGIENKVSKYYDTYNYESKYINSKFNYILNNNFKFEISYNIIKKIDNKNSNIFFINELIFNSNYKSKITNVDFLYKFVNNKTNIKDNFSKFEMLNGLENGRNYIFDLLINKELKGNLELSSNFQLRISKERIPLIIGGLKISLKL